MEQRPKYVLPIIVYSQFAGTSLWFAGNAVLQDLIIAKNLPENVLADITTSVQAGFIIGTLIFAITSISDRLSPAKIFLFCASSGAMINLLLYYWPGGVHSVLVFRFFTGVALAGIYPVGMKIAADWYDQGLGKALGYLVGALVIGTAFPHWLNSLDTKLHWGLTLHIVSIVALSGGLLVFIFLKDGPYRKKLSQFDPLAIISLFKIKDFRASVLGYFGHMWELYTFWAFTPVILQFYFDLHESSRNVPFWTFITIATGGVGCVAGGFLSQKYGNAKVAFVNLMISGICILIFPWMIKFPLPLFVAYMLLWGWTVVGDSPQFSSLSARTAIKELVGSGLTIMNSIGFAITIISIYLFKVVMHTFDIKMAIWLLFIGPLMGLMAISRLIRQKI